MNIPIINATTAATISNTSLNVGLMIRLLTSGMNASTELRTVPASQLIKAGDFVSLASNGTVSQSIALPGSNSTVTTSGGNLAIYGVAQEGIDLSSGGSTEPVTGRSQINVLPLDGSQLTLVRAYHATPATSAWTSIDKTALYNIGRYRGASASDWAYVLVVSGTTNPELKPVDLYAGYSTADYYAPVWVRLATSDTVRQG